MFRFTIRELVLAFLVVLLAIGWWLDHSQQVGRIWRLETSLNPTAYERWDQLQKQDAGGSK